MNEHIELTLSWRKVQNLNRDEPCIVYIDDAESFDNIHLTRRTELFRRMIRLGYKLATTA